MAIAFSRKYTRHTSQEWFRDAVNENKPVPSRGGNRSSCGSAKSSSPNCPVVCACVCVPAQVHTYPTQPFKVRGLATRTNTHLACAVRPVILILVLCCAVTVTANVPHVTECFWPPTTNKGPGTVQQHTQRTCHRRPRGCFLRQLAPLLYTRPRANSSAARGLPAQPETHNARLIYYRRV